MIEARLFGGGLADAGEPVRLRWHGESLQIDGAALRWTASPGAVTAAGFDNRDLRVDLNQVADAGGERLPDDGAYALFVPAAAREAFAAAAPAARSAEFAGARRAARRLERNFRLGWGLVVLGLALPLVVLVWALGRSDAIAGWVVERIPVAQEVALGDLVLAQTRAGMRLQEDGAAVAAVREIGERLLDDSRYTYRWFVAERDELNAFAAPGGVVVVFSGLIAAAETPEELAGVLAHEIAHAELRHGLRAMVKSIGLRAAVSVILGDIGGGVLADGAAQLTELKFSRDAEREADAEGLRRLLRAGIDPQGMVRFFARLAADAKAAPPALLSTHPDSEERRQALAEAIAREPPRAWQQLPVDWGVVRAAAGARKPGP